MLGPEYLQSYGDHEKSFFNINESVKARDDLFYLIVNTNILNMRNSVFIFVCKKEEWKHFLDKNLKDKKDGSKKSKSLLEILKLCMKVKTKFWTIPTMGFLKVTKFHRVIYFFCLTITSNTRGPPPPPSINHLLCAKNAGG